MQNNNIPQTTLHMEFEPRGSLPLTVLWAPQRPPMKTSDLVPGQLPHCSFTPCFSHLCSQAPSSKHTSCFLPHTNGKWHESQGLHRFIRRTYAGTQVRLIWGSPQLVLPETLPSLEVPLSRDLTIVPTGKLTSAWVPCGLNSRSEAGITYGVP